MLPPMTLDTSVLQTLANIVQMSHRSWAPLFQINKCSIGPRHQCAPQALSQHCSMFHVLRNQCSTGRRHQCNLQALANIVRNVPYVLDTIFSYVLQALLFQGPIGTSVLQALTNIVQKFHRSQAPMFQRPYMISVLQALGTSVLQALTNIVQMFHRSQAPMFQRPYMISVLQALGTSVFRRPQPTSFNRP